MSEDGLDLLVNGNVAGGETDSEEEDLPIRQLIQAKRPRREMMDPLSFPTPSQESASNHSETDREGSEDEDELSDYERQRRGLRPVRQRPGKHDDGSQDVQVTITVQQGASLVDLETASQSLPESQRSAEDFTLSRYAGSTQSQSNVEGPGSVTSRVLVDDSEESAAKKIVTESLSQKALTTPIQPAPPKRTRSPISEQDRSLPIEEANTSAEAQGDDELSQQQPVKRARTSPPSTLSYLNPLNYLWSASRPMRSKDEPVLTPVEQSRRVSNGETLASVWEKLTGGGSEERRIQEEQAQGEGSPVPTAARDVQTFITKSPSKRFGARHSASSGGQISSGPDRMQLPRLSATQLVARRRVPERERSIHIVPRPKLGGFKPDLVLLDGLSEKWVVGMTEVAGDLRRAKAARGKGG